MNILRRTLVILSAFLAMLFLLATQCSSSEDNKPEILEISSEGSNREYLTITTNEVKLLKTDGDFGTGGEFQFVMIVVDEEGESVALIYPGEGTYPARLNQPIKMGKFGASVDSTVVRNAIYVHFLGIDNDSQTVGTDIGTDVVLDQLAQRIAPKVAKAALATSETGPVNIIAFAIAEGGGLLYDWAKQQDQISEQGIVLKASEKWQVGTRKIRTADGKMEIEYSVNFSTEPSENIVPVRNIVIQPTPTNASIPSQPTTTPHPIPTSISTKAVPTPTPTVNSPSLEWVSIPSGNFTMGSTSSDIQMALAECNETEGKKTGQPCQVDWFHEPQSTVFVNGFEITKYEITNDQYNLCVAAGVCSQAGRNITDDNIPYNPGFFTDNYPVVGVNWYDADTFCRWVGGRLPTEIEWERTARGDDARRYPWGNTFDSTKANLDSGYPSAIGNFPSGASVYGVMDMAGNVFEWTSTQSDGRYVLRGGGWSKYHFRGRVTDRGTQLQPNFANYDIGFRCTK